MASAFCGLAGHLTEALSAAAQSRERTGPRQLERPSTELLRRIVKAVNSILAPSAVGPIQLQPKAPRFNGPRSNRGLARRHADRLLSFQDLARMVIGYSQ